MSGTKKQKMDIAKAIVEAIYSMDPPGRFLKKCPKTRQWIELSRREAADKAAQAMAYAINGESLKEKRREQQRSRLPPSLRPQDGAAEKSSPSVGRTTKDNHLGGVRSSSVARHHGHAALGGSGEAGTTNAQSAGSDDDHADADLVATNEMVLPGDSPNLSSQQLTQQLLQSSSTTLPTTSFGSPIIDQNGGLAGLLVQTLQQQQQQLPLQRTLGQDSRGLHALQTPLQPALLEGLTNLLLNQTQQQQQRDGRHQQQLLLQCLSNQQIAPSSATTLPPTLSLSAPFLTIPRSHLANSNPSPNQLHLQSNPSNALLLSLLSNVGISNAPPGGRQMDQLQRSLILQQQQLLASPLGAVSNDHSLYQQQQSRPLDPILEQAALQLRQILQDPPLPLINSSAELLHPPSSRGGEIGKRRR